MGDLFRHACSQKRARHHQRHALRLRRQPWKDSRIYLDFLRRIATAAITAMAAQIADPARNAGDSAPKRKGGLISAITTRLRIDTTTSFPNWYFRRKDTNRRSRGNQRHNFLLPVTGFSLNQDVAGNVMEGYHAVVWPETKEGGATVVYDKPRQRAFYRWDTY